jgi:DNA-binding GntR family transcriptional regulator
MGLMTPKQKYDERKRLRTERLLREERRMADHTLRAALAALQEKP